MSTISTDAIKRLLITRLLTYTDPDGHTLASALSTRLWREAPPPDLKASEYPFAVMSLKSPQNPDGTGGIVLTADLELMFFARPRGQSAALEALGDRAVSALKTYRDGTDGLLWFEDATAESLPTPPAPADPDVIQLRVMARLHCYPTLLSRLST